jgi:hypothetical protein
VNNQEQATSNLGEVLKEKIMDLQPQASLDSQEPEPHESAESESDTQDGSADSSSVKSQSEETNSI